MTEFKPQNSREEKMGGTSMGGGAADPDLALGAVESKGMTTPYHTDLAHGLFHESLHMDPDERGRLAKRVLRKLDFIVLPMVRLDTPVIRSKPASVKLVTHTQLPCNRCA